MEGDRGGGGEGEGGRGGGGVDVGECVYMLYRYNV